jgi:hypothetical protein
MRIFLIHSSVDTEAADVVAHAFLAAGADVYSGEDSLGAEPLRRIISKKVAERPVFVVLLSRAALASSWVLAQCAWAYDFERDNPARVMLPIVVEQLEPADLNSVVYLKGLKWVEASDLKPLPVVEAASQALRLLGMTRAGQAPASVAPEPTETAADLVMRGNGLTAQGRYRDAIPLFERATQLEPDNFGAWVNLGYAHLSTWS